MPDLYATFDAGGGGAGTPGDPYTILEADANAVAGDNIYVKVGTYDVQDGVTGAVLAITTSGTVGQWRMWRAYTSTIDDFSVGDAPPVVIDASTNTLTNAMTVAASYNKFIGFQFTGASSHGVSYGSSDTGSFKGCLFDGNGGRGFAGDNTFCFEVCEFTNNTTGSDLDNASQLIACKIHNEPTNAFTMGSNNLVRASVFYNNGNGNNLSFNGTNNVVDGCVFDGENQASSIGVHQSGSSNTLNAILNNIFFDLNVGVNFNTGGVEEPFMRGYNLFYSCTTDYDVLSLMDTDVSGTSDPFTSSATRDYTLKTGSEAIDAGLDQENAA